MYLFPLSRECLNTSTLSDFSLVNSLSIIIIGFKAQRESCEKINQMINSKGKNAERRTEGASQRQEQELH